MNKWKCEHCSFFGSYDELEVIQEIDHEPFGDRSVERVTYYFNCPDCGSDNVTEYAEVNW